MANESAAIIENDDASESNTRLEVVAASLSRLADAQSQEAEIKRLELSVRQQEIASNEAIAIKSIDAQERSQLNNTTNYNKHLIHRYVFIILLVAVILSFAAFALVNGAKDLVIDALKILIGLCTGLFGGFHWGKSKTKEDSN